MTSWTDEDLELSRRIYVRPSKPVFPRCFEVEPMRKTVVDHLAVADHRERAARGA